MRFSKLAAVVLAAVSVCLSGAPALSNDDAFDLGFHNPLDDTELSWTAQANATSYQLLCSTLKDCSADCTTFETFDLYQTDATEPVPGHVLHYLVRELTPDPGSWGVGSESFARAVSCMAPMGSLLDSSGCIRRPEAADAIRNMLTQDCIEYHYLGGGHLLLNHLNTAFNCCPEFEAGIDIEGDMIIVWEDEISGPCDCSCLFDLNYEIFNLDPGIYNVRVIQEYLSGDDEPLEFTMDLQSLPSGMHCVGRDHYPW